MDPLPPRDPDFDWLLAARADIQQDLLVLYRFVKDSRDALLQGDEDTDRGVFTLLVGAAFSLWRAAFLSHIDPGWPAVLDKTEALLKAVLETNAVPFSTELSVKNWMFGYYLNSALHRLAVVRQRLGDESLTPTLKRFDKLYEQGLIRIAIAPTECWQIAHAALRELTTSLTTTVSGRLHS
jgi:hypothetical protein